MTTLRIQLIDPSAPGSRAQVRAAKERLRRLTEAQLFHDDCVDAYNAAREAAGLVREDAIDGQLDNPDLPAEQRLALEEERLALIAGRSEATLEGLVALANEMRRARLAMNKIKDEQEQEIISRMTTDDGTSVEDVLDHISENDFQALIRQDVEAVSLMVPTRGGSN